MWLGVAMATATVLAACSFEGQSATSGDDVIDARPPIELVVEGTGDWSYDTDAGMLVAPDMTVTMPSSSIVEGVRVIDADTIRITGIQLRVTGRLPLRIAATRTIAIEMALVDAGSYWTGEKFHLGPGILPETYSAPGCAAPGPGKTCANHGASGGGGGGFGAAGGSGGLGGHKADNTGHVCDALHVAGIEGGAGGPMVALPSVLRGGCRGADGAPSTEDPTTFGRGSPGGGAIALVAGEAIAITDARIRAGGAGGRNATGSRAAGGGGGSGGTIQLDAPMTSLVRAELAANGGGGGGGSEGNIALPGDDALTAAVAMGGLGEGKGGRGGAGGFGAAPVGVNGADAERGGGGGGGGAGRIRLTGGMVMRTDVVISPDPIRQ